MAQICTICSHKEKENINSAILKKQSNRNIATQYSMSPAAVQRHKKKHLAATMTKAQVAEEVTQADNLLDQVKDLEGRALSILGRAEQEGDLRTACTAIREVRGIIELLMKVTGQLDERNIVNILSQSVEWVTVRALVIETLNQVPDLKNEFIRKLEAI